MANFQALLRQHWPLLLIGSAALLTHFIFYDYPLTVVLDEIYYGRFAIDYLKHEYFFDLHPPLGKLLLYLIASLAQLDPAFTFPGNMVPFPNDSYLVLRLLPRLAGSALPLVIYALARELGLSRMSAGCIGLLLVFENGLLVLSRFILLDAFILLFGFSALTCYLCYRRTQRWAWLCGAIILAGCALATKWTGLSFLGMIITLELFSAIRARSIKALRTLPLLLLLPVLIYYASFAAHFALAYRSGENDWTMSPAFQAQLSGNALANSATPTPALSFWEKFNELNYRMFDTARTMTATHPYSSKWYSWPLMWRGLGFWADYRGGEKAHIMLLGNPLLWWCASYAMLFLLLNFPPQLLRCLLQQQSIRFSEGFVLLGWIANLLPFVLVSRVVFLYHYMPSLIFAILALGYLVDGLPFKRYFAAVLVLLAAASFVYFAPLSYGLHLPAAEFEARFWLDSWR